ncbi:NtaA/DmoA family FMN-dependent monooxygenase [Subtercola frigoramans]|uniref:FMN-dependent oxidoreductase (Nitrilotriacetate monooxygenase family) n=1 Tax=Subtercola frigoramans TaxID=120298 RepID=A0ABS2L153_9MICO|nr:NtaA/DmoA family FMN-dependent monooxygenase [Subtercola frigoramans]MBM7470787.1 FMN-dependent oxidoreductase (nitrilotriacetate monooxygenase family) [Subtercola frigoramans]
MTKKITLGASQLMSVNFYSSAWTDRRNDTKSFATLAYWQEMARVLEAAHFDFLFFADVIGFPSDENGIPAAAIREAVQTPAHDPVTIVSGLAATVDKLNFVVTSSTTAERPFMLARRFGTLDHLTEGRIGWNIVNSDNQTALVKLLGLGEVTEHDTRYDRADEFVDAVTKLWEGSWEDDAVVFDQAGHTFADPEKVHSIAHHGRFFDVEGIFTVVPGPQRTPTLFQAGASSRGREFAARTAECVYMQEATVEAAQTTIRDVRERAARFGRRPDDIKILNGVSIVVADTEEEAASIRADLAAAPSTEALAMHFLGWTGINLLALDASKPLSQRSEFGHSTLDRYEDGPTVGEIIDGLRSSLGGLKITGTPESVAQQMIDMVEQTDLDGFLIEPNFGGPEEYRVFGEKVVPLLIERGFIDEQTEPTTLRQRLFGGSDGHINDRHRGAEFRVSQ